MSGFVAPEYVFQKGNKVGAAFALGQQKGDMPGAGIKRTEYGRTPILPRRWNQARVSDRCPHTAQAGIKMEFAFILEEECVSVGSGSHFFKAAVLLHLARRTSFGSCLCLRDNFGRL